MPAISMRWLFLFPNFHYTVLEMFRTMRGRYDTQKMNQK